jgi:hypothetical protein
MSLKKIARIKKSTMKEPKEDVIMGRKMLLLLKVMPMLTVLKVCSCRR